MLGVNEIGRNALLTGTTKNTPSFGSAYSPSFGNTVYHDEFVSSHDSGGVTTKQIGLFALIGLGIGAAVALVLKKPSAATEVTEQVEKVVEYRLDNRGFFKRLFTKNPEKIKIKSDKQAKLDAIRNETAEAGVSKVPNWLVRTARWGYAPNWFGKRAARIEGKRIAENALRVELAGAKRATNAPVIAAEAQAKADKIADKARVKKAKTDEKINGKKAKPTPDAGTISTIDKLKLAQNAQDLAQRARETREAFEIKHGTKASRFVGWFSKEGRALRSLENEAENAQKLANKAGATDLHGLKPEEVTVDGNTTPKKQVDPAKPAEPEVDSTAKPVEKPTDAVNEAINKITGEIKDVELSTAETNFFEAVTSNNKKYFKALDKYKNLSEADFEAEFNAHLAPNKTELINDENSYIDSLLSRNEAKVNYGGRAHFYDPNFDNQRLEYVQAYVKPKGYKLVIEQGELENTIAVNLEKISTKPADASIKPTNSTAKAAEEVATELSEIDKQGINLLNIMDKPFEATLYDGGRNFEEVWKDELPGRLEHLNENITKDFRFCLRASNDKTKGQYGYFVNRKYNDESRDLFVEYAQAKAKLIGHKLINIHETPGGNIGFNMEKI